MSFLKNIVNSLKSGRIPDAKSVADMAKQSLAEQQKQSKKDALFSRKEITDDMLSPPQLQLSRMNWDWRQASQSFNKGSGNAVKNWEASKPADDIFLTWEAPAESVAEYVIVIAWSGWAFALIQRDSKRFMPEYIDALMGDRLNTVRVVTVDASRAPQQSLRFPASESNTFLYVKLLGKTGAGDYVEIADYTLGSVRKREESKLSPVPDTAAPALALPDGSRTPNAVEQDLLDKGNKGG